MSGFQIPFFQTGFFDREEEHEILKELREKTERMPEGGMLISREQASFLSILIKLRQPTSILEIGTYTGYSALTMALSFDGTVTTCDRNKESVKVGEPYWRRAFGEDQQRIHFAYGDALQTLSQMSPQTYDFIFIDADKENSLNYFNMAVTLIKYSPSSLIIVDNFFLRGRLFDSKSPSKEVHAMRSVYNEAKDKFRVCVLTAADSKLDGMLLIQPR